MVRLEGLVDSGELTGPVGPQGEQGELGPQGEQGPQFTMVRTWRDLPTMVVSGKDIVDNIIGKIGTSAPGWTIYIPTHEDVKLVSTNLPAYHRLDITRADGTDLATIKVSAFGSGTQLFMCNSVVIERDQFHTVLHVTVTQEAMWCVCEFFWFITSRPVNRTTHVSH